MSPRTLALAAAALIGLAAVAGCGGDEGPVSAETDDSSFRDGQQMERQGRWDEALADYLKVIDRRGDAAPESNLDAGLIYFFHIKDPVYAIYHFRKYLELEPNSKQATFVRGYVDAAKREFARSLPGQPLENQTEALGIEDRINQLQRENDELRAENAALRAGSPPPVLHSSTVDVTAPAAQAPADDDASVKPAPVAVSPISSAPPDTAPPASPISEAPDEGAAPAAPAPRGAPKASAARHHTVVRGDTLFSLAQKYYGNRSRWRDIFAANRAVLPSENSPLRIGMDLRIP
ncbi:MAG TPA: LysM peptidoglycan-binding domain-containing protein [Opitutaceae bacterium]|jgi:tetratricopeptide (TPR) repeat protein